MPIYMRFPNVVGTGKGNHTGWIEIESAQMGYPKSVQNPSGSSPNQEASTPLALEVMVTRCQDIASDGLCRAALGCDGQKVVIDFVSSSSKNDVPYMSIELQNAFITSYSAGGRGGASNDRPMESLVLCASKVTYTTTPVETPRDPKHVKDRASWHVATRQATAP